MIAFGEKKNVLEGTEGTVENHIFFYLGRGKKTLWPVYWIYIRC